MEENLTSKLHKDRNRILGKYAEHSFSAALDEVNESLKTKKTGKTGSLSAKAGY